VSVAPSAVFEGGAATSGAPVDSVGLSASTVGRGWAGVGLLSIDGTAVADAVAVGSDAARLSRESAHGAEPFTGAWTRAVNLCAQGQPSAAVRRFLASENSDPRPPITTTITTAAANAPAVRFRTNAVRRAGPGGLPMPNGWIVIGLFMLAGEIADAACSRTMTVVPPTGKVVGDVDVVAEGPGDGDGGCSRGSGDDEIGCAGGLLSGPASTVGTAADSEASRGGGSGCSGPTEGACSGAPMSVPGSAADADAGPGSACARDSGGEAANCSGGTIAERSAAPVSVPGSAGGADAGPGSACARDSGGEAASCSGGTVAAGSGAKVSGPASAAGVDTGASAAGAGGAGGDSTDCSGGTKGECLGAPPPGSIPVAHADGVATAARAGSSGAGPAG
jgi:hypothetical protein